VWDVTTGERLLEMPVQDTWQASSLAISPGGRYLTAVRGNRSLAVFDLQTGKPAGEVPAATLVGDSHGAFQGCSFSPDGRLLALVFVQTNSRLVFVDMASGTVAEQLELAGKPPTASAYRGAAVEWIGERAWCLFGGTILDRKTRRIVWHLDLPIGDRLTPRRTLPGGWVAVSGTGAKHQLGFLPIPWSQIEASLQALAGDTQPLLKPGMAVSVKINIERLRFGTAEDTKARLADIFRERFRADGIEVQDDQPVVLTVAYAESEGATLHERQGLMGPPTGRTVQATSATVKMSLVTREGSRQLWSDEFTYDPRLVTVRDQQVTDATVRDAILKQLLYQLSFTPIPYFVPRDKNLNLLPGSTKIEGPDLKPAVKKPATRDRSA
jgi:hypothetical protein